MKLVIYTSTQGIVKTISQNAVIGYGPTTVNFTWDGTSDYGNGSPYGLYLFKFTAGETTPFAYLDIDSEKSAFLSITAPDNPVFISDDDTTAIYHITYTLASDRRASDGKIEVYDPHLAVWYSTPLSDAQLDPGTQTVRVTFPSPVLAGEYEFLVSVKHNHADRHKAHLTYWALQHNQRVNLGAAIAWAHGEMTPHANYFVTAVKAMGYKRGFGVEFKKIDPNIGDIRGPLTYFDSTTKLKPLEFFLMSGHGTADGMVIELKGPHVEAPAIVQLATMKLVVPSQAYFNSCLNGTGPYPWVPQQDCLILDTDDARKIAWAFVQAH